MWNKIKDIFSAETDEQDITSENAIAAILVRAAKTDNEYTESEKKLINHLLSNQLNISLENAILLRIQGEKLEIETKVLSWKRGLCKGLGKGIVDGEIACEAEMTITIPEILDQYIPKKK